MANVPDSIRALVVALHQLGGGAILQGQAGARLNITPLGTGTDTPWEDCYSVDVSAAALARVIEALGGPAGIGPALALPGNEPSQWSAAAVAHTHSQLYADVTDLFNEVDPESLLDDVFASPNADASLTAYEQLVTGEWDGEL